MICQSCGAEVDNDLIFCTNCGGRLSVAVSPPATVVIQQPVATQPTLSSERPKTGSNLKWIALIVALVAIPASLFIAYRLLNNSQEFSQNSSYQTNSINVSAANHKTPNTISRQSTNASPAPANLSNANSALINQNSSPAANSNEADTPETEGNRTQILSERIEIAPTEEMAHPFVLESEAKIFGEVKVLQGAPVEGYVFFQEMFDEHSVDPTYKVFSFEGKNPTIEQKLVEGKYVLVFINNTRKPIVFEANFHLVK
jgi:hypothetical protein